MVLLILLGGLLISMAGAVLLTPLFRREAVRQGWTDDPSEKRKVHDRPIPRGGGIAIIAGSGLGLTYFLLVLPHLPVSMQLPEAALVVGALAIGITGLYDDLYGLGFKRKFVVQLAVAYAMVLVGHRIDLSELLFLEHLDPYRQTLLSVPITLVWIVGVVNAVNLIDGLDGLAAGISIIALTALAAVFNLHGDVHMLVLAIVVAGATAGFLVYNFNPASIFMGDAGSMFLGFIVAMYALQGTSHVDPHLALLVPVLAVGLPVLDTGLSFTRRLAQGKSPFMADGDHIHHRMVRGLHSHRTAVLVLYVVAWAFGALAVLLAVARSFLTAAVVAAAVVGVYVLLRCLGYVSVRRSIRAARYAARRWHRTRRHATASRNGHTDPGHARLFTNGHIDRLRDSHPAEQHIS